MFKYHFYKHSLPLSITKLILPDAPTFNYNLDSDIVKEWLAHHSTGITRNTLSFKGPLFFLKHLPSIESRYTTNTSSYKMSVNNFKNCVKSFVFSIQSQGNKEEWEGQNTPLYNVPGIPRVNRKNILPKFYAE